MTFALEIGQDRFGSICGSVVDENQLSLQSLGKRRGGHAVDEIFERADFVEDRNDDGD